MSNTNTKTGKESSMGQFFQSITNSMYYNRPMEIAVHNGVYGLPYAVIGMVTLVTGIFAYVTYTDYASEVADTINQESDEIRQDIQYEDRRTEEEKEQIKEENDEENEEIRKQQEQEDEEENIEQMDESEKKNHLKRRNKKNHQNKHKKNHQNKHKKNHQKNPEKNTKWVEKKVRNVEKEANIHANRVPKKSKQ